MQPRLRWYITTTSLHSPSIGSRVIHHVEGNFRSRTRRLESNHLVFGKVLSHHCGLTMFGNSEDFFVLISLLSRLLCNPNKIL